MTPGKVIGKTPSRMAIMRTLVTGGVGIIGSHLVDNLLERGQAVTVDDNFDPIYPPEVKEENVSGHLGKPSLVCADIRDYKMLKQELDGDYGSDV